MPLTVEEILAHADEFAVRFGNYQPGDVDQLDVEALQALLAAVAEQLSAERHLLEAIKVGRESR